MLSEKNQKNFMYIFFAIIDAIYWITVIAIGVFIGEHLI